MSHTNSKTIERQTSDVFSTILKTTSSQEWKACLPRLQLNVTSSNKRDESELVIVIKEFSEKSRYKWLHPEDYLDEVFADAGVRCKLEWETSAIFSEAFSHQPIDRVFYAQVGYFIGLDIQLVLWGFDLVNRKISTIVAPVEKVTIAQSTNNPTDVKKFLRIKKDWEQLSTQKLTEDSLALFPLKTFLESANLALPKISK